MPILDLVPADASAILLLLLILAGVVVAILLALRAQKKRREAFRAQAQALGLSYVERGGEPPDVDWRSLDAMNDGINPRWENTVGGSYKGHRVLCSDFIYYTVTHDSKGRPQEHRHDRGVALLLLGQDFPKLSAVPENIGHKIWDAIGGDDIDFESDEFSRKFWVKSDDRKFAYDVLHARAMELLLTPGWSRWELRGPAICLWDGSRPRPEQVPAILDRLVAFADLIPGFRRPSAPVAAARAS